VVDRDGEFVVGGLQDGGRLSFQLGEGAIPKSGDEERLAG
jgi:hypothetical protein